jgi:two-component SAPR family response regulator
MIVHFLRKLPKINVPPYRLRINLLGPLEVWRSDGTAITGKFWRRAKVRRLFVALALKRGQLVPRDELIAALWPDKEHAAGLRNLNTTVYNLRRSLEPDLEHGTDSNYLFYESDHYWLGGGQPHWIDLDAFKLGIQQARLEKDTANAIHYYKEALALYRGDYLVDLSTEFSAEKRNEQHELRELYLAAMEEIGVLYQQQEQIENARQTYLKILAVDPERESTFKLLARLSQQGSESWADSIAYCQRLAAALKDELDLILSQDIGGRRNQDN